MSQDNMCGKSHSTEWFFLFLLEFLIGTAYELGCFFQLDFPFSPPYN